MSIAEIAIRDRLIEHGSEIFNAPKQRIHFTKVEAADSLLNDLKQSPHAFVIACVMDRQIKAERAWLIPYKISLQIGSFTMDALRVLSEAKINKLMSEPEKLHRFISKMSGSFCLAIRRIDNQYGGDASQIWSNNPSSAEVVYRFLQFDGVGPKIASMATNILAREMKIPMSDYYSIDISADVHVKRVFSRLGMCDSDPTVEQVIFKARCLNPEFPGIMDLPCWEIGRNWCKPQQPLCSDCYMGGICPSANSEVL
jgi:endonuclease-3